MKRQFTYELVVTFKVDGQAKRRKARVRASSPERAMQALKDSVHKDYGKNVEFVDQGE